MEPLTTFIATVAGGLIVVVLTPYITQRSAPRDSDNQPAGLILPDGARYDRGSKTPVAAPRAAPARLLAAAAIPGGLLSVWALGLKVGSRLLMERRLDMLFRVFASPLTWAVAATAACLGVARLIRGTSIARLTVNPRVSLVVSAALVMAAGLALPAISERVFADVQADAFATTIRDLESGDVTKAERTLDGMLEWDELEPRLMDNVLGRKAQAAYKSGRYSEAADLYARVVEEHSDSDIAENARVSLMWSVRRMPEQMKLGQAVTTVESLAARHPRIGISVVWLGISAEKWATAVSDPGGVMIRDADFLAADERELLEYLSRPDAYSANRPDERAKAMWLLGRYEDAMRTAEDPEVFSWAAFQAAELHYELRQFDEAAELYRRVTQRAKRAPLADDSYYRLGRIAELKSDLSGAVSAYLAAMSAPDGSHQRAAQTRVAFMIETAPRDAVTRARTAGETRNGRISEAFVRRLVALGAYPEACAVVDRVGADMSLSREERVAIASLARDSASASPEALARMGRVFLTTPELTYDPQWSGGRAAFVYAVVSTDAVGWSRGANDFRDRLPVDYYSEHNGYVLASRLLERSLVQQWNPSVALDLLRTYCELAEPGSFVESQDARAAYEASALDLCARIQERSRSDKRLCADAQDLVGQLSLKGTKYDFDDVIERFSVLASAYPDDNRANNALKWVGWAWELKARESDAGSPEYLACYREAAKTYETLIARYPRGHVAVEAKRSLRSCESVIAAWK